MAKSKKKSDRGLPFPQVTLTVNPKQPVGWYSEGSKSSDDPNQLESYATTFLGAHGEVRAYAGISHELEDELFQITKSRATKKHGLLNQSDKRAFSFTIFVRTDNQEFNPASIYGLFETHGLKILSQSCSSNTKRPKISGRLIRVTADCDNNTAALAVAKDIHKHLLYYVAYNLMDAAATAAAETRASNAPPQSKIAFGANRTAFSTAFATT